MASGAKPRRNYTMLVIVKSTAKLGEFRGFLGRRLGRESLRERLNGRRVAPFHRLRGRRPVASSGGVAVRARLPISADGSQRLLRSGVLKWAPRRRRPPIRRVR